MKAVNVFGLILCVSCSMPPDGENMHPASDLVASALAAINECRNTYREVLGKDIPDQVDMAHVDVFGDRFSLAFTRGDSPRLGRESPNYTSYAACSISRSTQLQLFLYRNDDGYFAVGKRSDEYDREGVSSESPIFDLAFKKADQEFRFFEARPIPSDW